MEKCLFLYNPQSGKGKIAKKENEIVKMLSEKFDVKVCRSQYAGNIGEIVLKDGENFDVVVVAGGDGTLNEVIGSVIKLNKKPKIGYIPSGTVNDVAHSLGIPKNIKKAVNIILHGQSFQHDIFKVNDHYGIYVCCSGIFTESSYATNQSQKKKIGKIAYWFYGAKKLFTTKSLNLKLKYEGGEIEGKFAIMLIINSKNVAGFKVNKKAQLNDGLLDVVLIRSKKGKVNIPAIIRVAKFFLCGVPKKSKKNSEVVRLDKFTVETTDDTVINIDGERADKGSFTCEVIRNGVEILVPKN